jgi:hypothetical protein
VTTAELGSETAAESGMTADAVGEPAPGELLERARKAVLARVPADDALAATAVHLIGCAADVVALIPRRDLAAAQEALSTARAAVTTATYAVWLVHEEAGRERT